MCNLFPQIHVICHCFSEPSLLCVFCVQLTADSQLEQPDHSLLLTPDHNVWSEVRAWTDVLWEVVVSTREISSEGQTSRNVLLKHNCDKNFEGGIICLS